MNLKRSLGLGSIIATSAGLTFATASFVASAQVAGFLLGDSAWIAILVAGLLVLLSAACFSELNGLFPSAAGLRLYLRNAFNDRTSLVVSLVYMIVISTVIGAETYALSHVLSYSFPAIPPTLWVIVMLGAAAWINVRGIKVAGNVQNILTVALIASLVLISLISLGQHRFTLPDPLAIGGSGNLFNAVAVGIFLFVAFEWVTPLAEEVTDSRLISRGMFLAVGLLSVVYALFTVAMRQAIGAADLTSPIPQILMGAAALGRFGVWWMTIVSLIASLTTFNAGMITVSRFIYASAREGVLPKGLSHINPKHATPHVAIYSLFGLALVVSLIVLWTQKYLVLINVGAATESLVYMIVGLAVWRLRRTKPQLERPYRIIGGSAVGIVTTVVFLVLALGVVSTSPAAGVYLIIAVLAAWIYVRAVVPQIQARREAERKSSSRRRQSRRPTK